MSGTLLFETVGTCILIAHAEARPDPEEWSAYIARCAAPDTRSTLILTPPGCPGPNAAQRGEAGAAVVDKPGFRSAVVTSVSMHRGIVTAISWMRGNEFKAFSPKQWREAFVHTGAEPEAWPPMLERQRAQIVALGLTDAYAAAGVDPGAWRAALVA